MIEQNTDNSKWYSRIHVAIKKSERYEHVSQWGCSINVDIYGGTVGMHGGKRSTYAGMYSSNNNRTVSNLLWKSIVIICHTRTLTHQVERLPTHFSIFLGYLELPVHTETRLSVLSKYQRTGFSS